MQDIEEFDKLKTKVLKYILYKKRTEQEIRQKFSENAGNNLENVIEYLKENDYINDNRYIEKAILEFKKLKNLSIKELKYKLFFLFKLIASPTSHPFTQIHNHFKSLFFY